MQAHPKANLKTFIVEVSFFSNGERFASEHYTLDAVHWYQAEKDAIQISIASPYDNPRIPDLRREAVAREI
jgi:hypothetical protein